MLRAYFVHSIDEEYGFAVIAQTSNDAKKIAFNTGTVDCEYIDIRSRWIKDANVEGLEEGVMSDDIDALRRRMYNSIEGTCEGCGQRRYLHSINGKVLCWDCYDQTIWGDA